MQSVQIMSWKQKKKQEAQGKPALESQVTMNILHKIISFSHASKRSLPHRAPAEKRNTHTGMTSLRIGQGQNEVGSAYEKKKKEGGKF